MNSMNSVIEPTASQVHDAVDRTASKVAPAIDKVADVAHRTINRVAEAAAPAADWAVQSGQQVTEKYKSALDSCESMVRERPVAMMAGALFIGYLFGRFSR